MRINRDRYDSTVSASIAEGPSDLLAAVKSWYINYGVTLTETDEVIPISRITIEGSIDFPEKFQGLTLLGEINADSEVTLWDDIDDDHRCIGRIDWFDEEMTTLHLAADITNDSMQEIRRLLLGANANSTGLDHYIAATAIGMESIEFEERQLLRGVAVTEMSISVKAHGL